MAGTCIIGGHTLLPEGTEIPDNSVVMGTPGKVVKERDSSTANIKNADFYYENGRAYACGEHRVTEIATFKAAIKRERNARYV